MKKILAASLLAVLLAACSSEATHASAPTKRDTIQLTSTTKSPVEVIHFKSTGDNLYPDVSDACDGHGHRVFVTAYTTGSSTDQATSLVVVADRSCPGSEE